MATPSQDVDAIQKLEIQIAQLSSDKTALAQQKGSADTEVAKLRQDLEQLRTAASNRDAQLVAQQYSIRELSKELEGQKGALEHEQESLAAGRDIRDLMTARNLHIIDVHDQDARGESHPFGRIFLTEGKLLIFYAYDLDTAQIKNASFQAWGQRTDGVRPAEARCIGVRRRLQKSPPHSLKEWLI
jgi:predicted RNase H-like nuclease (RuvC/YqgF family)